MTCIATKEKARLLSDGSLYNLVAGKCLNCAIIAHTVLSERAQAKNAAEKASDGYANTEKQKGEGQLVNDKPKARSSHDLGFLIRDKSGELTQVAVKDIDSAMLHDILDRADEIVISRVDVK